MPNGLTGDQMLERLYTETVGIDGRSGMKGEIRQIRREGKEGRAKLHAKVDEIRATMMSKGECAAIREAQEKQETEEERRRRERQDLVVKWLAFIIGPAGGAGLLLAILKIIDYFAARGGP